MKDLILKEIRKHTQDEPITGKVLGEKFGLASSNIRTLVNELRRDGHQIASDTAKGYWWALDENELTHTDRSFLSRIGAMRAAMIGMHKSFAEKGQLTMQLED